MGNSYSVAREEQEEEEFQRLVEAVEYAQQRVRDDDLETGLHSGPRNRVPQYYRQGRAPLTLENRHTQARRPNVACVRTAVCAPSNAYSNGARSRRSATPPRSPHGIIATAQKEPEEDAKGTSPPVNHHCQPIGRRTTTASHQSSTPSVPRRGRSTSSRPLSASTVPSEREETQDVANQSPNPAQHTEGSEFHEQQSSTPIVRLLDDEHHRESHPPSHDSQSRNESLPKTPFLLYDRRGGTSYHDRSHLRESRRAADGIYARRESQGGNSNHGIPPTLRSGMSSRRVGDWIPTMGDPSNHIRMSSSPSPAHSRASISADTLDPMGRIESWVKNIPSAPSSPRLTPVYCDNHGADITTSPSPDPRPIIIFPSPTQVQPSGPIPACIILRSQSTGSPRSHSRATAPESHVNLPIERPPSHDVPNNVHARSPSPTPSQFERLLQLHERSLSGWERQMRLWQEQNVDFTRVIHGLEKQLILLRRDGLASTDSLLIDPNIGNTHPWGEKAANAFGANAQVQSLGRTSPQLAKPYPHRPYAAGLRAVQRCSDDWSPPWTVFPLKAFRGSSYTFLRIRADWDDADLLRALNHSYDSLRTVWRKWFSLRSVRSITMVYADHSCVYPRRIGPARISPSKNMRLRYFLRHPDQMKGRHEFMQVLTARTDLGIEFVESWQVMRIAIAILIPVIASLIMGVLYSLFVGDVSDGFTIAGYMTSAYSVCLVLLGVLNLVEF